VNDTARSVPEWIGATPDAQPPLRVKLRVFERHNGVCHVAKRKIRAGEPWECDHILAIINGGENRESNLAPILKDKHKAKTAADVRTKSKTAAMKAANLGLKPKSRLTHPTLKRRFDGTVVPRSQP